MNRLHVRSTTSGGIDNPRSVPSRLRDVAEQDRWEQELRRVLTGRAAQAPPLRPDLAGRVLARARRSARRRSVAGIAAVVCLTMVSTGILIPDWWSAEQRRLGAVSGAVEKTEEYIRPSLLLPSDERLAETLAVDVLREVPNRGVVFSTAWGEQYELAQVGQVQAAQRLETGWVVASGQPGSQRLSWVDPPSPPISLLAGLDQLVLDGDRVAWLKLGVLATARVVDGELVERVTTTLTGDGVELVGLLGSRVLLRQFDEDGVQWDFWDPARGPYRPAWSGYPVAVFGLLPDGERAVGLVPDPTGEGGVCLAALALTSWSEAAATRCLPAGSTPFGPAVISPDRRLMLVASEGGGVLLVQLDQLFDAEADPVVPVPGMSWPGLAPVWLGGDRVLWTEGNQLVVLWPERLLQGSARALETAVLKNSWLVVAGRH